MLNILENETRRQEYMEFRYKNIDEGLYKQDTVDIFAEKQDHEKEEVETKYSDEGFTAERMKILNDLGLVKEVPPSDPVEK